MKKLSIVLLLLLFAGMQSLAAQEASKDAAKEGGTLTVKVTPSVYGEGKIYLAGEEASKGDSPATDAEDAEGRVKFEADYNGIGGVVVEVEGAIKSKGNDAAVNFGFGSNAYAYAHVLKAFGVDKKVFDAYLQSGLFEVEFDNAQNAGNDSWKADVTTLERDKKVNMQLDLKIMDLLTIRYGLGFADIDSEANDMDMGWGLLLSKKFGDHKIDASLAYIANTTSNLGPIVLTQKVGTDDEVLAYDFDQLGFSLAYTGTFDNIVVMPFFNLRLKGLAHKPKRLSFVNPLIGWSAGIKFQLRDKDNGYDLFGLGLDLGGETRQNNNYNAILDTDDRPTVGTGVEETATEPYRANAAFKGVGLKLWTDGLRAVMGKNYLGLWASARLELNDPSHPDMSREGYLAYFGVGLEQYFVNVSNATVKLKATLETENLAPMLFEGRGYVKSMGSDEKYESDRFPVLRQGFKTTFVLALDASFTAIFKSEVK